MIFHFVPLVFVAIIDKLFKETVCRLSVDVFSVVLKTNNAFREPLDLELKSFKVSLSLIHIYIPGIHIYIYIYDIFLFFI